jgi:hypothetical protein
VDAAGRDVAKSMAEIRDPRDRRRSPGGISPSPTIVKAEASPLVGDALRRLSCRRGESAMGEFHVVKTTSLPWFLMRRATLNASCR